MILSIVAYGNPILRQRAKSLELGTDVKELVAAMFATMDQADGVGLAAPQIGQPIRLFVVNFKPAFQDNQSAYKKVYINPILHIKDDEIQYQEEGCLSIPQVMVQVPRKQHVTIDFFDINWERKQEELVSMQARIIQHEYDHLEGKLHIDYASSLQRRLLQRKLNNISQGKIVTDYPMLFANKVNN